MSGSGPAAPRAPKKPHQTNFHGIVREDPYAWLKDERWQEVMKDPTKLRSDIREHLEAENAYTHAVLADTEALQKRLFQEMKGRIKEDDSSVPSPDGPWSYYARFEKGAQHPRYARRPTGGGAEQVTLDADARARGEPYFKLGVVTHSPDHRLLGWAVDRKGSEYFEVSFIDLETGTELPDRIADTAGDLEWSADATMVFYTVLDENHRPCKIMRHRLGTPIEDDELVYEEPDPGFFLGLDSTEDRRFIIIDSHDHTTSEVRLLDATNPTSSPRLVAPRERDVEYEVSGQGRDLVILTNADGAEDFKVVRVPATTPDREHWKDEVPHRPGVLILSVLTFADYVVRLERERGLPRIVVRHAQSGDEHEVAFDEKAYSLGLMRGYEYDTPLVRFTYSSPTTPRQTFDYDMGSRTRTLLKEQEVPSGHDPEHYRCDRIHATTPDGSKIPISLLWHRDTPIDGTAPVLLYGYGSYGITIPADFGTARLSLVDRGFIYAIAHVRGSKAGGYAWYRQGKLMSKRNTFDDFIATAEHLVAEGWAAKGNITIEGGSAGGMLVGVAANLRPDLWRAVVAEVPFVDVLTTMCDDQLPLTPPEWPEWGNPIENRVAGGITPPKLPHHRAYGSVHGGSSEPGLTTLHLGEADQPPSSKEALVERTVDRRGPR